MVTCWEMKSQNKPVLCFLCAKFERKSERERETERDRQTDAHTHTHTHTHTHRKTEREREDIAKGLSTTKIPQIKSQSFKGAICCVVSPPPTYDLEIG